MHAGVTPRRAGRRTCNSNLGVPVIAGTHPGPRPPRRLLNCHGAASRQPVDGDQVVAGRPNPVPLDGAYARSKMHHHLLEHPPPRTSSWRSGFGKILNNERQLPAAHEFAKDQVALLRRIHQFEIGGCRSLDVWAAMRRSRRRWNWTRGQVLHEHPAFAHSAPVAAPTSRLYTGSTRSVMVYVMMRVVPFSVWSLSPRQPTTVPVRKQGYSVSPMRQRLRGMESVVPRRGASREGVPGQAAETRRMVGGHERSGSVAGPAGWTSCHDTRLCRPGQLHPFVRHNHL